MHWVDLLWLALFVGAEPLAMAQDKAAWTRIAGAPPAQAALAPVTRLGERNGGSLRLEAGRLLRSYRKRESELGCTLAGGPGELRALAADPFGLSFIAAERGLFVGSPESDVIDRVRLGDGAPSTAPNSLLFDAKRRLWLASDTEFGVLEPSHFFGRSSAPPAPGPYRLLGLSEGGILLASGRETWIYKPDLGPPPVVESVASHGRPLAQHDLVQINFGESLGLSVEATAAGGAVLRYALDGSHVWSLLTDIGAEIEPGEHRLALLAMDRDLNLGEPFELRVRVLYPIYYQKWFVLLVGAGLSLAVFAWFYARARRAGATGEQAPLKAVPRSLLSTGLLLVIGLQILAGAIPHGRGWPFIGYSMYTASREVGHIAYNGVLVGFGKRGVPLHVPLGTLGVAADNRWQVLRPVMHSGAHAELDVPAEVIRRHNAAHPEWEQLERLQVWAKRTLIGVDGPIEIAPLILSDYRGASEQ